MFVDLNFHMSEDKHITLTKKRKRKKCTSLDDSESLYELHPEELNRKIKKYEKNKTRMKEFSSSKKEKDDDSLCDSHSEDQLGIHVEESNNCPQGVYTTSGFTDGALFRIGDTKGTVNVDTNKVGNSSLLECSTNKKKRKSKGMSLWDDSQFVCSTPFKDSGYEVISLECSDEIVGESHCITNSKTKKRKKREAEESVPDHEGLSLTSNDTYYNCQEKKKKKLKEKADLSHQLFTCENLSLSENGYIEVALQSSCLESVVSNDSKYTIKTKKKKKVKGALTTHHKINENNSNLPLTASSQEDIVLLDTSVANGIMQNSNCITKTKKKKRKNNDFLSDHVDMNEENKLLLDAGSQEIILLDTSADDGISKNKNCITKARKKEEKDLSSDYLQTNEYNNLPLDASCKYDGISKNMDCITKTKKKKKKEKVHSSYHLEMTECNSLALSAGSQEEITVLDSGVGGGMSKNGNFITKTKKKKKKKEEDIEVINLSEDYTQKEVTLLDPNLDHLISKNALTKKKKKEKVLEEKVSLCQSSDNGFQGIGNMVECFEGELEVFSLSKFLGEGVWDVALDAKNVTEEYKEKIRKLEVVFRHPVHDSHKVERRVTQKLTDDVKKLLETFNMKGSRFSAKENEVLLKNWENFCEDHDFEDFEPFIFASKWLKPETKREFVQYLGHGLPQRPLHQIYTRIFTIWGGINKDSYSPEDDEEIVKMVESGIKNPFAILSRKFRKTRSSLRRRYGQLKQNSGAFRFESRRKYQHEQIEKLVKLLIKLEKCAPNELKNRSIPLSTWNKVGETLNIRPRKLYDLWRHRLHTQLFAEGPLSTREIHKKIIKWLYDVKPESEGAIRWNESTHLVPGSTNWFMFSEYRKLRRQCHATQYAFLPDFVRMTYENCDTILDQTLDRLIPSYRINSDLSISEKFTSSQQEQLQEVQQEQVQELQQEQVQVQCS